VVTFDFLSVNTVTKLGLHLTNTSNISIMFCPIICRENLQNVSANQRLWCHYLVSLETVKTLEKVCSGPPYRLPMFQLVLRKQFDKLEKELVHYLSTIAFVYR
jgi:hypothetical protein